MWIDPLKSLIFVVLRFSSSTSPSALAVCIHSPTLILSSIIIKAPFIKSLIIDCDAKAMARPPTPAVAMSAEVFIPRPSNIPISTTKTTIVFIIE